MALFPNNPLPSSVSVPAIIDPAQSFQTDSGYQTRRALHSRPRRRFTLEYLGKRTEEYRVIADFLQSHRFGAGAVFEWFHPTAVDVGAATNSTPIRLDMFHQLITGMWIYISTPAGFTGVWQITRLNVTQITLNGSTARGAADVTVHTYLPYVVARMNADTWESPVTLIGPDQVESAGRRSGYWNFSVQIEEVF